MRKPKAPHLKKNPKGGRPFHVPTEQNRRVIRAMRSYGINMLDICNVIDLSYKTVARHYRKELDTACPMLVLSAGNTLAQVMAGGEERNRLLAAMFILKARGGWKDHHVVTNVGPNGGPQEIDVTIKRDYGKMNAIQLRAALKSASAGG